MTGVAQLVEDHVPAGDFLRCVPQQMSHLGRTRDGGRDAGQDVGLIVDHDQRPQLVKHGRCGHGRPFGWCRGCGRNSRLLVRPCRSPGSDVGNEGLGDQRGAGRVLAGDQGAVFDHVGSQLLAEREKSAPLAISSSSRENSR